MPEILDVFNNDAFAAASMTAAMNLVPNRYGRINELGLFPAEGIATTTVAIAIQNGVLNLLPMRQRGAPPSLGAPERGTLRPFIVPHIPHDDAVLATDVQNRIALNPAGGLDTVIALVNRKLFSMRNKHAVTLEHMRNGALRGLILDYDGSVVIDLFAEFGVTPKVVDFALGTAGTDIAAKCREVLGHIEDNLQGDTMTGVHALASPEWFAKLIGHAKVTEAYKYYASAQNPLRDDVRRAFPFAGITFEEYRGSATKLNEDKTTTPQRFVPAGDVRFFPVGTTDTFATYFAPPDFVDLANVAPGIDEEAQVFVAPLERMRFGKGVEIHSESNPLPMVKRPAVLVRGYSSN